MLILKSNRLMLSHDRYMQRLSSQGYNGVKTRQG